ncbi:cytochrome b [Legionella hackeliae]|uniref:Cytochrome b561 transmembrane protein n=1 Tax=Legionella hackeliae TaxID=449 RepID=A0A0A8URF1_LEGHA|nr:cytochrome b [Legionella hackeliae]KTD15185.1 cytochrome b561 transmembrane protein [Legionella hackeliae]CEK11450.1 Cytochrome b561 transmembrane protein [Legionella hackeliae]STX48222.1 cytochrome b561 transmembrane protein [Legionella hackeliae]
MRLKNNENAYGFVSIFFHWLLAVLMIGLLILGLYMVKLPISLEKLKLYGLHKEYGFLVLGLAILRVSWRWINITPKLPLPAWEKFAARAVHWIFYGFMFALPITGWLITSAAGLPASFFGLITLPDLIAPNEDLRPIFEEIHEWLAYGLIAFIALHVAAALKHHFINKDDILRRMI